MRKILAFFILLPLILPAYSQLQVFDKFVADSSFKHAEIGFCLMDADSGKVVFEYNSGRSMIPASVIKLFTSAAAFELLGPDYIFKTIIGYTGILNKRSGKLDGNIIIKGGGDPALGSGNFEGFYSGFPGKWIDEIRKLGIRKIKGIVISDDSYYDYFPIPAKWLWEDAGNYYGAGAYGLSVYDNTYEIHFKTNLGGTGQMITRIVPEECNFEFTNWLVAAGTSDQGYVFAAPYSTNGWLAGTIPANLDDFVLKASIADPPRLLARIIDKKLKESGIIISGEPTTSRLLQSTITDEIHLIAETVSPPLKDIVTVLNHESINLYAEHFLKELGKKFRGKGSTESGIEVVYEFLRNSGIDTDGVFIVDGSGVSPLDAISPLSVVELLRFMRNKSGNPDLFLGSLPEAGKEGTLKNYFKDPVFDSVVRAKSGSMTRVRNYAGYIKASSGRELIFCIFVHNYTGQAKEVVAGIEEIIKDVILSY